MRGVGDAVDQDRETEVFPALHEEKPDGGVPGHPTLRVEFQRFVQFPPVPLFVEPGLYTDYGQRVPDNGPEVIRAKPRDRTFSLNPAVERQRRRETTDRHR